MKSSEEIKILLEKLENISKTEDLEVLKKAAGLRKNKFKKNMNEVDDVKVKLIAENLFDKVEKKFGKNATNKLYEKLLWKMSLAFEVSPRIIDNIIMENNKLASRIEKIQKRAEEENKISNILPKTSTAQSTEKLVSADLGFDKKTLEKMREAAEAWIEALDWNPKQNKITLANDISKDFGLKAEDLKKYLGTTDLWDYVGGTSYRAKMN